MLAIVAMAAVMIVLLVVVVVVVKKMTSAIRSQDARKRDDEAAVPLMNEWSVSPKKKSSETTADTQFPKWTIGLLKTTLTNNYYVFL